MIIYEKENKLNISFDNSTEAEPDVVISKEDGQVNIEAGGQPIGGGGGVFAVEFTNGQQYHLIADKTLKEIYDNAFQGILCVINGGPTHISSSFANFNFAKESDGRCNISLEMTSGGIGYTILYMYFSSEEEIDWNATDWTFPD